MAPRSNAWHWAVEPAKGPAHVVVCDIDGVLADAAHRSHHLDATPKDWAAFFAACSDDVLIEEVARLLSLLRDDLVVVLLTGRPVDVRDETIAWLERFGVRWDGLIMRDSGSYASSRSFKQQAVRRLRALGLTIDLAIEDAPLIRDMFRDEGIPCLYIHSGYHEG